MEGARLLALLIYFEGRGAPLKREALLKAHRQFPKPTSHHQ